MKVNSQILLSVSYIMIDSNKYFRILQLVKNMSLTELAFDERPQHELLDILNHDALCSYLQIHRQCLFSYPTPLKTSLAIYHVKR